MILKALRGEEQTIQQPDELINSAREQTIQQPDKLIQKNPKKPEVSWKEAWDRFYTEQVDRFHPIVQASEVAEKSLKKNRMHHSDQKTTQNTKSEGS